MQFDVALDRQHLERLAGTQPIRGIISLISNSLDADADEVRVEFGRNELAGIEEIRVIDNGHGMTYEEAKEGFGRPGGSLKATAGLSKGKQRALHGGGGRGRFRATAIAGRVRWRTVAADPADPSKRCEIRIELRLSDLVHGEISDPKETNDPPGTTVALDQFVDPPTGIEGDTAVEELTGRFGAYLQSWNARLVYDQTPIPKKLQTNRLTAPMSSAPLARLNR